MSILINKRNVGDGYPPFIVAEMSANHHGSIDNAYKLILAAKQAGADAVKIQTYTPDTITIDSNLADFQIKGGLWAGKTLYQLYGEAFTPWDWHRPLFDYAKQLDITIFSSPFDKTAVDLLVELDAPAIKIASFELIDLPLIRYAASARKPMILSTGMASREEIGEAIQAAYDGGCQEIIVLHCISGYPASADDYNLATMLDIKRHFGVLVGLSDHTVTNTTAVSAVALGANFVEKHFTLDTNGGGPDDAFSIEPEQLAQLCCACNSAWRAMGKVNYERSASELGNKQFRRSLYVVDDVQEGDEFTELNVRSIRPGFGCAPKLLDEILGKKANQNVSKGTPMSRDFIRD